MANIEHLLNDIRKDKYCQEMRETFCNALIETNKAAEEMESTVKKIKNEITSVNANAEIIDARGSKGTLGERLNEFDERLDSTLPIASSTTLGGVKIGANLSIDSNGVLSAINNSSGGDSYILPIASRTTLGGVKIGNNLSIDSSGVLSATTNTYSLPIASNTRLGGIKVGNNLTIDSNGVLSAVINNNGNTNTLDNYSGATLNDKMVAMFNDINTNHKNTPMIITLPDGVIEITSDLRAIGWTNKIFIGNSYLYYKNCNAIEFVQCMHCNFYIHASSSSNLDIANGNILGLINPSSVASLNKRGYKITDCSYNEFKFNNIIGFTNGIEVYSEYGAKGTFYNNIYFAGIWRCQRPIIFRTGKASDDTSSQSGWITEIYVHGGMFDCDDGILVGQEVANRPANEPSDNYQGLKFYNLGIEHVRKKENGIGIYFLQGKNNSIINPRFEGSLLTGNSTSGAYILVKESGYACNNRIETSNYPINVDRVELNYLAKQLANPNYDNPAGSYIEGDLYDNGGFRCGYKAIATPGKMVYEAKNLSNYYLNNAKNNTFNYTYSDTEFAKVKCSDGTIKTIGYTS